MEAQTQPLHPATIPTTAPAAPKRSRARYQAQRRTRMLEVVFSSLEEKLEFEQAAHEAGYVSVTGYLLQLLRQARSGHVYPPGHVESLTERNEKLTTWLDQAREEAAELRRERAALQAENADLCLLLGSCGEEGKDALAEHARSKANRGVGA